MKGLILKDLYNIAYNMKSMFFLLIFVYIFTIRNGAEVYIVTSGVLFGAMVITTFSFDDKSNWIKYAMTTPINKNKYVMSKFIVLLIFCLIGVIFGTILGVAGELITSQINNIMEIIEKIRFGFIGFIVSYILGCTSIPLLFKFEAEKARMITLVTFFVPSFIFYGVSQILSSLGIEFNSQATLILLICLPFIIIIWNWLMYKISCYIFKKRDL